MSVGRSIYVIVVFIFMSVAGVAWAHGGGLNKEGARTRRGTGDYHCHGSETGSSLPLHSYSFANGDAPSESVPNKHLKGTAMFANCAEARAAGAVSVRRRDPGYGSHLDRDNDGIGCEPYRGRRYISKKLIAE